MARGGRGAVSWFATRGRDSPPLSAKDDMAVEITGNYTGELKMELTHGPSGVTLRAAAPQDNGGDGSSFSPTDLLATALGSCAVMTMAIVARPRRVATRMAIRKVAEFSRWRRSPR